jgi:hypothetical protein
MQYYYLRKENQNFAIIIEGYTPSLSKLNCINSITKQYVKYKVVFAMQDLVQMEIFHLNY